MRCMIGHVRGGETHQGAWVWGWMLQGVVLKPLANGKPWGQVTSLASSINTSCSVDFIWCVSTAMGTPSFANVFNKSDAAAIPYWS